ncbi:hypothetical protein QL285_077685 [Trifolium repens]|nr:hypothetical protein QL285_077685 [Trifolium repens]
MLGTVEAVAKLAAIGLGLDGKAISSKMTLGPHQLVSTGIDLGAVNEGTVLEPPHVDMNLLTIQGSNRYLGLHIWSKQGQKVEVNIPIDHFLILAGKQLEHLTGGRESCGPKT